MKKLHYLFLLCALVILSCKKESTTNDFSAEIAVIENSLLPSIAIKGDSIPHFDLEKRMEEMNLPGLSVAVIKDGQLRWAKGYGVANITTNTLVDENTLFQAGSISKPVAALAILQLAQQGKVDLDTDVNTYLKQFTIPEDGFTTIEKVTLRRLLTHTAGTTVHGFPGYKQTDSFPSDLQVIKGEGNTDAVVLDTLPGSMWRYSGGGYTIMEQVVEDVSGKSFQEYVDHNVLAKMEMANSTYSQPLNEERHSQASAAYDFEGNIIEGYWNNYPEQAAAGLWTTPSDLAKYVIEIQEISAGKANGVISQDMAKEMLTQHKNDWGLGPVVKKAGDSLMFGHGGKNAGFTNDMKASVYQGNGIIVMTNGDSGNAIIGELVRGISNYYDMDIMNTEMVEVFPFSEEEQSGYVGIYKLDRQVPGIGDYHVKLITEQGKLTLIDSIDNQTFVLQSVGENNFRDFSEGEFFAFQKDTTNIVKSFVVNNRFNFQKVN